MLKISDFARVAHVSTRTLHYYDEIGLLKPAYTDAVSGYRYYQIHQLARLNRILLLKNLGFTLDEMRLLLDDNLPVSQLRDLLGQKRQEIQQRLDMEKARLQRAEMRLQDIEREGSLRGIDVTIKENSSRVAYVTSRNTNNLGLLPHMFAVMTQSLYDIGIDRTDDAVAIHYLDKFTGPRVDIELLVVVEREGEPFTAKDYQDRVQCRTLPGENAVASTVYKGSYGQRFSALHSLVEWVARNGYSFSGHLREIFHHHEGNHEMAENVVEMQIPVVKAPIIGTRRRLGMGGVHV